MENRKFVIPTLLFFLLPIISLAYDEATTHPALTREAIKLFQNAYSAPALSAGDIKNIERGSSDEDSAPRWIYHFYEPHSREGLWGFLPSKLWVEDPIEQSSFVRDRLPFLDYFSHKDDYSWERGIYEYVYGNRDYALKTLGHVVHLVQDKAVPEHTRLDAHNPSGMRCGPSNLPSKILI